MLLKGIVIFKARPGNRKLFDRAWLKAMDGIYCSVLYNSQTSVLSTTTQRKKLLSKYTAQKQHRRANSPLTSCKKVVALNRKTNAQAACQKYPDTKQSHYNKNFFKFPKMLQ